MNELFTLAFAFDPWTYALVALVALLLFGKRLPEVGRSLGRGIAEFKRGMRDVQDEIMKEDEERANRPKLRPPAPSEDAARQQLPADQSEDTTETHVDEPK